MKPLCALFAATLVSCSAGSGASLAPLPLAVTPSTLDVLASRAAATAAIRGGVPPYAVALSECPEAMATVKGATLSVAGASALYSVTCAGRVTDSAGSTVAITVTIVNPQGLP